MPYESNLDFFAVKFKAGTYMPHLPVTNFMDTVVTLPDATGKSLWLNGSAWQFPNYDNVEIFVDKLVREGLLVRDDVVDAVLQEQPLELSPRSVQRRFLYSTGLTHNSIRQIARARQAMSLLQNGAPIIDVVHEAGYADQPHMTRSLKHFVGQTPAQIVHLYQTG